MVEIRAEMGAAETAVAEAVEVATVAVAAATVVAATTRAAKVAWAAVEGTRAVAEAEAYKRYVFRGSTRVKCA